MATQLKARVKGKIFMKVVLEVVYQMVQEGKDYREIIGIFNNAATIKGLIRSFSPNREFICPKKVQKFKVFVTSHMKLLMVMARNYPRIRSTWTSFDHVEISRTPLEEGVELNDFDALMERLNHRATLEQSSIEVPISSPLFPVTPEQSVTHVHPGISDTMDHLTHLKISVSTEEVTQSTNREPHQSTSSATETRALRSIVPSGMPELSPSVTPGISVSTEVSQSTHKEPVTQDLSTSVTYITPGISVSTEVTQSTLKEPVTQELSPSVTYITPGISVSTEVTQSTLKEPVMPELSPSVTYITPGISVSTEVTQSTLEEPVTQELLPSLTCINPGISISTEVTQSTHIEPQQSTSSEPAVAEKRVLRSRVVDLKDVSKKQWRGTRR